MAAQRPEPGSVVCGNSGVDQARGKAQSWPGGNLWQDLGTRARAAAGLSPGIPRDDPLSQRTLVLLSGANRRAVGSRVDRIVAHCSLAYSAWACLRVGISWPEYLQSAKKSWKVFLAFPVSPASAEPRARPR